MNKKLLVLRKFMVFLFAKLVIFLRAFLKAALSKKTVLFVSHKKIRSYSVSPAVQLAIVIFVVWIVDIFIQSVRYDTLINKKVKEISQLKKANGQFEKEVDSLNENLEKINTYFNSVSKYNNASSNSDIKGEIEKSAPMKFKNIFGDMKLTKKDYGIAIKIANSNAMLETIKDKARLRIEDLQKKISITGLSLVDDHLILNKKAFRNYNPTPTEISLNDTDLTRKQGGPFTRSRKNLTDNDNEVDIGTANIKDEISYLSQLEKFVYFAPLSKPMNNYYVSSSFGERTDPIRGERAVHMGMDFVGREGEKILSPSRGKVIFAGKFGSYGTGIVIDHGYGITTRYGHLSKVKVSEGDYVKRGDVIAIQGSTGRSTGSHLHYEVRYKNTPLNPKKFLQAGQAIFNDDQTSNNVDS
jgi:murein DD-endopeptidase MepM/ murein hydrolase activator NlpD